MAENVKRKKKKRAVLIVLMTLVLAFLLWFAYMRPSSISWIQTTA